jgi:hypothetical protein
VTATTRIQGTAFNTTHMPSLNPPPIWAKLLLSGSVSTDEGGWLLPAYSAGSPHEAARRCLVTPSRVLPASWVPTPEGHPVALNCYLSFPCHSPPIFQGSTLWARTLEQLGTSLMTCLPPPCTWSLSQPFVTGAVCGQGYGGWCEIGKPQLHIFSWVLHSTRTSN